MLKKLNSPIDMTVGTPWKCILIFALPLILGNIAQQLYNTVDSIVVGKYIGDNALASVGSCAPILNILLVLFVGISSGTGITVSQYVGAKNREGLSYAIGNSITIAGVSCLFLIIAGTPLIRPILLVLNTPDSIIDGCTSYLMISLIGIAGLGYYNILSGILRGLGDSFSSLVYLLVATVINIVLDIYFVAVLKMGVGGVALATVIAQLTSSVLCLIKLTKMTEFFDFKIKFLKPVGSYVKTIVRLGLPTGLLQVIMSSAMVMVQSLTNQFGELLIAANVVVMRVDGFAMLPNFSFGMAMASYTGQNVGARLYDRVHKGVKQGVAMAVGCSACITIIILIFGKHLMGIFTDTTELVELSYYLMTIIAVGYLGVAVTQSLSGTMQGAGDTTTPMWVSLFTTIIVRVPLTYGISYLTRSPENPVGIKECIHLSLLTAWLLNALVTFIFFKIGKWKTKAIQQN